MAPTIQIADDSIYPAHKAVPVTSEKESSTEDAENGSEQAAPDLLADLDTKKKQVRLKLQVVMLVQCTSLTIIRNRSIVDGF
jgi:hypothetical protein